MVEYDATNPRHLKEARKQARALEQEQGQFITHIMGSTSGRAWIYAKLLLTHVFETSFTANALSIAFREGERNVGLTLLLDVMKYAPKLYLVMMEEANGRDAAFNSRLSRSNTSAERRDSAALDDALKRERHPAFDDLASGAGPVTTDYDPTVGLSEDEPE